MSQHRDPHSPELIQALKDHHLVVDQPSQLSDGFRCGWYAKERSRPDLTVWFGDMPESNGKRNWTVLLQRAGACAFGNSEMTITITRTEFYDRARYEYDRLRFIIGEITDEPDIMAYDPNILVPPNEH